MCEPMVDQVRSDSPPLYQATSYYDNAIVSTMSRKGQREKREERSEPAPRRPPRRYSNRDEILASGGKPRERERRSTRSRPLIYDKGERWPEWCKLGVISHHLGIRCTLCASRVEHAISVRAVPSSAREENCILERKRKREGGGERE